MIAQLPDPTVSPVDGSGRAYLPELATNAEQIRELRLRICDNTDVPTTWRVQVSEFLEGAEAMLQSAAELLDDGSDLSPVPCGADVQSAALREEDPSC